MFEHNRRLSDVDKVQDRPIVTESSKDVFADLCSQVGFDGQPLVSGELKEKLGARIDFGERKYGSRLMTYNGRDVLVDIEQEGLDGVQYTHQAVMEGHRVAHIRRMFIQAMEALAEYKRSLERA